MRFSLVIGETFQGLRRNASMVISVILVTFVSLTFVGAAALMQIQIAKTNDYFQDRALVDIYMCSPLSTAPTCVDGVATDEQIAAVQAELDGPTLGPLLENSSYLSPDEAYQELIDGLGEEYSSLLTAEQTSAEFHVNLTDPSQSDVIVEAFSGINGVEEVTDQLAYLDPLFATLTVATYIAVGIGVIMLISAALLVSTTIRLSAIIRRKSVSIMRFVGASNRFIQMPFVLEGVFAALVGSILASATLLFAVHFGIDGYIAAQNTAVPWIGMAEAWLVVPALVIVGVLLAAISASFAIRRWLRT